jgi:hypothetical protein
MLMFQLVCSAKSPLDNSARCRQADDLRLRRNDSNPYFAPNDVCHRALQATIAVKEGLPDE